MRLLRLPRIRNKEKEDEIEEMEEEIEEISWEEEEEEEREIGYSDVLLSQPSEKKEKIKGKEYLVSQFSLLHEEKKSLEREAFGDAEEIKEKKWEKTAPENLEEIEKYIDEGLFEEEVPEEEVEEEKEEEEIEVLPKEEGERVYGKIINREIVYESPGGYVVKVTYKEGDSIKTSYYSVSKVEGVEHSLDKIRTYKPIITPTEEAPKPMEENKEEKKSVLDKFLGKK